MYCLEQVTDIRPECSRCIPAGLPSGEQFPFQLLADFGFGGRFAGPLPVAQASDEVNREARRASRPSSLRSARVPATMGDDGARSPSSVGSNAGPANPTAMADGAMPASRLPCSRTV